MKSPLTTIIVIIILTTSHCLRYYWQGAVFIIVCLSVCYSMMTKKVYVDFHGKRETAILYTRAVSQSVIFISPITITRTMVKQTYPMAVRRAERYYNWSRMSV